MLGKVLIVWNLMMTGLSVYEEESEGTPTRQTLWGDSVIDYPSRMKRHRKYSISNWEKSHSG